MKWIKKLFQARQYDTQDRFSQAIVESLGGLKEKTEEFATAVQDYALEREMAELRERITKLEAVLMPLRNGSPTH